VGGSIVRDLLSNEVPAIMLPQEIYALAAASGAAVFYFINAWYPSIALLIGASITFLIRVVSDHQGWVLPTAPSHN